jgi:hypothetical protein
MVKKENNCYSFENKKHVTEYLEKISIFYESSDSLKALISQVLHHLSLIESSLDERGFGTNKYSEDFEGISSQLDILSVRAKDISIKLSLEKKLTQG